jgi:two-component system OmpR family response regulator
VRILVVEDQLELGSMLAESLSIGGFVVDRASTIGDTLEAVRSYDYPIVILDRRLPDGDAICAIKHIRMLRPNIRVLVLTALRSLDDRISGLDAGADDYLTKPFATDELLARIRASLRRPGAGPVPLASLGSLTFDFNLHEATVCGAPVRLRKRELLLLEALMRRAGRAVTHSAIIENIYAADEVVQTDALRMLVSRLRQRLREAGAGVDIYSTKGVGYLIAAEGS